MVHRLPAGSLARLPALRAGRSGATLRTGPQRGGAQPARQFAGPQMGTDLHHPRHLRRRLLRLVPALLLDLVRRGVLCVAGYSALLRGAGRLLRIPPQARQRVRREDVQRLPAHQRCTRPPAARHRRFDPVHRRALHGRPPQLGQCGRRQRRGDLAMDHAVARTRCRGQRPQPRPRSGRGLPRDDARMPVLHERYRRRGARRAGPPADDPDGAPLPALLRGVVPASALHRRLCGRCCGNDPNGSL